MARPPADRYSTHQHCFGGLDSSPERYDGARFVIIPVPYDSTVSHRSGARLGPRAVLSASVELELFDLETRLEPAQAGIFTLGEVEPVLGDPTAMLERVRHVASDVLSDGKLPVLLGGEHALTIGAVEAARSFGPVVSVHLDAHADLRDTYLGSRLSHACTTRRIADGGGVVVAGCRSMSREELDWLEGGQRSAAVLPWPSSDPAGQLLEVLPRERSSVYLSIDLDVLDPSVMSAVGTPEPGGMQWAELLSVVQALSRAHRIVGFDVVELAPEQGPPACASVAAALVHKTLAYLVQASS